MTLTATVLIYLLLGTTVSVAVYLAAEKFGSDRHAYLVVTALLFWPLYLPILLSPSTTEIPATPPTTTDPAPADDAMAATIARVEAELDGALASMDDWADDSLQRAMVPLDDLRIAWRAQANQLREMDQLLVHEKETDNHDSEDAASMAPMPSGERDEARQKNVAQLRDVRERSYCQLMDTLSRVRELASMIHLAKYADASTESRDQQIATFVQSLAPTG